MWQPLETGLFEEVRPVSLNFTFLPAMFLPQGQKSPCEYTLQEFRELQSGFYAKIEGRFNRYNIPISKTDHSLMLTIDVSIAERGSECRIDQRFAVSVRKEDIVPWHPETTLRYESVLYEHITAHAARPGAVEETIEKELDEQLSTILPTLAGLGQPCAYFLQNPMIC